MADALRELLALAERSLRTYGVEFAVTLDASRDLPARIGFLQARRMLAVGEGVELAEQDLSAAGRGGRVGACDGAWRRRGLRDVIVRAASTSPSRRIAGEIEALNHRLVAEGRGCVLLGFGRWGSSDPWLGIPVRWAQISGARAIVERRSAVARGPQPRLPASSTT